MARDDWSVRPAWWEPWIPEHCPVCSKPWLPGLVRSTWSPCSCPGATGRPSGHVPVRCAHGDCRGIVYPPEHQANWTEPRQRWR